MCPPFLRESFGKKHPTPPCIPVSQGCDSIKARAREVRTVRNSDFRWDCPASSRHVCSLQRVQVQQSPDGQDWRSLVRCQTSELRCHCMPASVMQSSLIGRTRIHRVSEDSSEASPQTKVAIIAPRDEHCSRTCQMTIRTFSKKELKPSICPDASATLESFSTHAHHAERLSVFVSRKWRRTSRSCGFQPQSKMYGGWKPPLQKMTTSER